MLKRCKVLFECYNKDIVNTKKLYCIVYLLIKMCNENHYMIASFNLSKSRKIISLITNPFLNILVAFS